MEAEGKPEQIELNKKTAELSQMEVQLAQSELDLATLSGSLRSFEARYLKIVGVLIAELDDIEAQILEAEMQQHSNDEQLKEKATEARAKARDSAEGIDDIENETEETFKPTEEIKGLYRKVAKLIHPDLSNSEEQRDLREQLMTEANLAYQRGDENRLQEIMNEWESSPETVEGEGIAAELVRIIRKIAQITRRLQNIESEIALITASDLHKLYARAQDAASQGRDLIAEMAEQMKREISKAKKRLRYIILDKILGDDSES